jgi:hypothetical protein
VRRSFQSQVDALSSDSGSGAFANVAVLSLIILGPGSGMMKMWNRVH